MRPSRYLVFLLVLVVFAVTAAPVAARGPRHARMGVLLPARNLERRIDDLLARAGALEALTKGARTPEVRRRVRAELAALRADLGGLRQLVADGQRMPLEAHGRPSPPVAELRRTAMETAAFEEAVGAVKRESFADGKLRVLSAVARHNWFTVEQVRLLLTLFSFESNRVDALRELAPRLVDPENGFRLYEAFTFKSHKEEAERILGRPARPSGP